VYVLELGYRFKIAVNPEPSVIDLPSHRASTTTATKVGNVE
jgi:hypothetical protein